MNVYVIGSISQEPKIRQVAKLFEQFPSCTVRHVKSESGNIDDLIDKCFDTICNFADIVVVVPKSIHPVLLIGDGVRYEMAYAKSMGKPVLIWRD